MEWSDVQIFLAVARSGTVRGAAHALRVDASTVSRRVAALEQAAGARLFERTRGGFVLTASGQTMLESSQRMDAEIEGLRRRLVGADRRLEGVVRVTFPGSFTSIAHEAMAAFARNHPAVEVELLTLDLMVDVDGRQADVAIRVAGQPPEHLVGRRVATLAGALYASRAYLREHGDDLCAPSHSWVDWDRRLGSKPAFAWLAERFPGRRIVARGLSTADVAQAVRSGVGIGPLPCLVADPEPELVRLADAPAETWSPVWLLTHADLKPAARVRAVVAHLARALRDGRARIEGRATTDR
jgi:DNA-binding transcriptional LysR family regulator